MAEPKKVGWDELVDRIADALEARGKKGKSDKEDDEDETEELVLVMPKKKKAS